MTELLESAGDAILIDATAALGATDSSSKNYFRGKFLKPGAVKEFQFDRVLYSSGKKSNIIMGGNDMTVPQLMEEQDMRSATPIKTRSKRFQSEELPPSLEQRPAWKKQRLVDETAASKGKAPVSAAAMDDQAFNTPPNARYKGIK